MKRETKILIIDTPEYKIHSTSSVYRTANKITGYIFFHLPKDLPLVRNKKQQSHFLVDWSISPRGRRELTVCWQTLTFSRFGRYSEHETIDN
jgi:hypothetical protein